MKKKNESYPTDDEERMVGFDGDGLTILQSWKIDLLVVISLCLVFNFGRSFHHHKKRKPPGKLLVAPPDV